MKFIPKYITTDILAEYGEHLTHEAYNEMVKLNSTQGDYNTKILNQLFNTDEGIQIPYLDNKIKKVTDDQLTINEDMDQIVADMKALAGSLSKYTTICETRKMIQNATQGFVKTNKLKAGDNVDITVDALNNVTISAHIEGGDVTKEYVDEQDASTLQESKTYTDNAVSQIDLDDYATKNYVDDAIADIPIPVVPTNVSAFINDAGYITSHDIPPVVESDPYFSASPAAGITATDITNWSTPEVYEFDLDNNNPIDLIGLKKGLYIVKNTTNNFNQDIYYSPFRQGSASVTKVFNCGWFYVLRDITNDLPTDTELIYYYTYNKNDGATYAYTISTNSSASTGITSAGLLRDTVVTTTTEQTISGSKLFTTIPQTNQQASENNHIINKKYFDEHIPPMSNVKFESLTNTDKYIDCSTLTQPIMYGSPYYNCSVYLKTDAEHSYGSPIQYTKNTVLLVYPTPAEDEIVAVHFRNTDQYVNGGLKLSIGHEIYYRKDTNSNGIESKFLFTDTQNILVNNKDATISKKFTFSDYLPESPLVPTTADQLVNKTYVDNAVAGAGGGNNKIVAIDTDQDFVVADMPVENCVNTIFKQISITIKGESTNTSNWNISNTHLLSYRVLADYSIATDGDPVFVLTTSIENADGQILINYETFSKDTTNPTGLSVSSEQGRPYSIPAKYWFFDEDKQPNRFGQTDALHFINANRYQTPFVFENKEVGLYAFTPSGLSSGRILGHCFKGTSANTSNYETPCLLLLVVKEYNSAANEDDIAIGFGAGDNGPITFGFKKDTTQASGIRRTNTDYYNPALYMNTFSNESVNGIKTFGALPRISSYIMPTNILQLVPYGYLIDRDAATYNASNTYNKGDFVRYQNKMYQCKTDGTTGTWNNSNWTETTTDILNNIISYINNKTEIHYVEDSDLTNQCFILKGKTKGIYLFTHAVGLLYDSTNTPSQTNPEVCRSGILWLNKDVDPNDTTGGVVGAMVSHAHVQNGETYVPSDCTMIITAPAMPSTMSGVVLSGGTGSPVNAVTPDVIAPNYSWQNTYNTGDLVTYDRKLYQCNSNNVTGSWNASYWTQKTLVDLL